MNDPTFGKRAVIIGAGIAGLALATELADEGFEVEVLEAKNYLGGRASSTVDPKMHDPVPIGPHVFAQSYNNFFRFLRKINARKAIAWEREVFLEIYHKGTQHSLRFYNLPAAFFTLPWILFYPFMDWRDKASNVRLLLHIGLTRERNLEELDEINALQYLQNKSVSPRCIEVFWRFIVLSLLNVPLEQCSAAEFALLVKRWAHLKRRKFGFSKIGLSDVYTDEAREYIHARKGTIHKNSRVVSIHAEGGRITSIEVEGEGSQRSVVGDIYISTMNPEDLRQTLPEHVLRHSHYFDALQYFSAVPYISTNLWFDKKITRKKFWALLGNDGDVRYLNTDFYDLSNIYEGGGKGSYIASNIIHSEMHHGLTDEEIIQATLGELREVFPHMDASLVHAHVHRIPYVVYAPKPGTRMKKLTHKTPIHNFYLAGDWTTRELPQCMEAAVRSGYRCAEVILRAHGIHKQICDERVY